MGDRPRFVDRIRALGILWLLAVFPAMLSTGALAQASTVSSQVCANCHTNALVMLQTKHGVKSDPRTPFGSGKECQACHGDASKHVKAPTENSMPVKFGKKHESGPQSEACLTCHKGGKRIHWDGGAHERTGQTCASCHNIHAPKDQVLVRETQAGVCFTCHKDKRAEILRFSSHPIKTGAMTCSNCHNPHGSVGEFNLVRDTVNETCYQCHADKRGPFLWEHPPAREDCSNCHNPHGTSSSQMLKARMPYLCQSCHNLQFHPSTAYSGSNLPPFPKGGTSGDKMLGQSCANCHSKVHGSNHPAGARFTR